ncbi:MAG: heme biosynthesis HemY N-terminal domain-containing protein [Paracoccaceae bacterium]|nr:heme biosynthesis HemY N-terminal domain-containing protein [Paracoccaceae bacterium]
MLWSLIKIVLFIGIVAALAFGAGLLLESEGGVRVSVAATEFTLGPLESVIAALVLLAGLWVLLKLISLAIAILRFMSGDETALSRWWGRNQERRGFDALSDGMMALASGEGRLAMTKAARAERYLKRPELTNLLTAQAAEMVGDRKKAEETYKKLLADDRTRFVGVRGVLKQKLADGDTDTALKLAEKAFALKPRHEETQDVLLKLQAGNQDWKGARKTLGAKLRHGALPRDVHRRRDAVLALSEARDLIDKDASIGRREATIEANKLSPDLVPAAVMAADQYIADKKPRYAARVLKKAWAASPHPNLAAAFARIDPDETPEARIKRFGEITRIKPNDPETRMLVAELNIAAGRFDAARAALGDLAETDPTARSLTIMAAVERGSGAEDAVVKGYLARALTATRGPQWVCGNCHTVHAAWDPVCDNCGAFDSLAWTRPSRENLSMPAGEEMLPLIVGQPEPEPEVEDAETIEAEAAPTGEPANTPDEPSDDKTGTTGR